MKAIAQAVWAIVPNKAVILFGFTLFCVFMSIFLGGAIYVAFNMPVWNGKVAVEAFHDHVERYPKFNMESVDAVKAMSIANREFIEIDSDLKYIRRERRSHERELNQLVDKHGNWKSDFHKILWERRGDEIKMEMDKMEEKYKENNSTFSDQRMYASRDK